MINNLPENWEIGFLNDKKTNEIKGSGIDKFDGNKNYLSTESIKNNKINSIEEIITYEKRPSRANLQPETNDVFFAKMKDTEKVLIITEEIEKDYILSTGFMPIKVNQKKLHSQFLTHYFKSDTFNLQKNKFSNGGTQKALNNGNAEKIFIPIPPLPQQEKILKVLDLSSNLIEKQKELLKNYDLFLKSKFIEIFGDPILNPMGWKTVKLNSLCKKIMGGGTPSTLITKYFTGNIPWVTPKDMKKLYISNSKISITDEAVENSSANKIPANSFLMVIRSGILKKYLPIAVNTIEVTVNQDMKAFIFNEKTNNSFIMYFFKHYQKYLLEKVRSVTADNLKFDDVKNIDTILPPIELQNKFNSIVEKIETIKEKENQKLKQLENLHNSLMQKAFNGEIQ